MRPRREQVSAFADQPVMRSDTGSADTARAGDARIRPSPKIARRPSGRSYAMRPEDVHERNTRQKRVGLDGSQKARLPRTVEFESFERHVEAEEAPQRSFPTNPGKAHVAHAAEDGLGERASAPLGGTDLPASALLGGRQRLLMEPRVILLDSAARPSGKKRGHVADSMTGASSERTATSTVRPSRATHAPGKRARASSSSTRGSSE